MKMNTNTLISLFILGALGYLIWQKMSSANAATGSVGSSGIPLLTGGGSGTSGGSNLPVVANPSLQPIGINIPSAGNINFQPDFGLNYNESTSWD